MSAQIPEEVRAALARLCKVAKISTNQGDHVANFLLAWWNGEECGGFKLTELWSLDTSLARDCCRVLCWIAVNHHYPDDLGFRDEFMEIIRVHRAHLLRGAR